VKSISKLFTAGLLVVLAGGFVANGAQADQHAQHGPVPFSVFDMDQNGSISETEFYSVRQQRMAAKASEGKKMKCMASAPSFADLDTNGDGQLSPEELSAGQKAHMGKCQEMGQGAAKGMGMHGKGMHGKGMKGNMPAFPDFDLDGDGVITEVEFNEAHAKRMSEMAAKGHQMKHAGEAPGFSGIDSNGDGGISAQEFSDHQAAHHQQMHKDQSKQD